MSEYTIFTAMYFQKLSCRSPQLSTSQFNVGVNNLKIYIGGLFFFNVRMTLFTVYIMSQF